VETTHHLYERTVRVFRGGEWVEVKAHVAICLEDVAQNLAIKANRRKNRTTALEGAIIVTIDP
jgi:hypothetical protein